MPLPWNYYNVVLPYLRVAGTLLDMGTGGGEVLSRFQPLPPVTYATEQYKPNVAVAREKLETLGVPEPKRTAEALQGAASHPDLSDTRREWVPGLLLTARPGFGAQCLEELADRYRQTRGRAVDLREAPSLPLVLGSSDFLARLLLRHPPSSLLSRSCR